MQTLTAVGRPTKPRSAVRELRVNGQVPGVVYGKNIDNQPISVDEIALFQLLRQEGQNAVFHLNVGDKPVTVMVRDLQKHPIKNIIEHFDLIEINMKEEMIVEVPVEIVGEAAGEKEGGIVQKQYQAIEVKCLPGNIPDSVLADVSALNIGDSFTAADLKTSADVEILLEGDIVLISILPPTAKEELESAEDEDQEPELIGGGEEGEADASSSEKEKTEG